MISEGQTAQKKLSASADANDVNPHLTSKAQEETKSPLPVQIRRKHSQMLHSMQTGLCPPDV